MDIANSLFILFPLDYNMNLVEVSFHSHYNFSRFVQYLHLYLFSLCLFIY